MEATAPRVPWWYFAVTGLVMLACLGLLIDNGFPWSVQIGAIILVMLGLRVVIRLSRK